MLRISEQIYGVMTRMQLVNFYVIANGDSLTVVDIGIGAGDVDRLNSELQSQSWSLEQVKHILITHAHPDHIGGLATLQERCNAQTYIHRLDAPIVRGSQAIPREPPENLSAFGRFLLNMSSSSADTMQPGRIDTELNGGEVLVDILPGLEVVPLPGHSYGQCGFWLPDDRLLIGGDVLMKLPWGLTPPIRAFSADWNGVFDSIRKVADLEPQILCLGHGPVVRGNVRDKLAHLL